MSFHLLTIVEKKRTTPSSCYLTLEIPLHLQGDFKYKAGQYIQVEIKDESDVLQKRCYSICGSIDASKLSICVKKVKNGIVSSFLFDETKIGNVLSISLPKGDFTLEKSEAFEAKNNIFVSAGSGITPIKSQIEKLLHEGYGGEIFLVYGNNEESEIIFHDYFRKINEEHSNFNLILTLREASPNWKGDIGALTKEKINSLFTSYNLPLKDAIFHISGPQIVIDNAITHLNEQQISNEEIFVEFFFNNAPINLETGNVYKAKIKLNGKEYLIDAKSDESILDASIRAGIDIEHNCKVGSCLSCVATLKQGSIIAQNDFCLSESQKRDNVILCCQSYPTDGNIEITLDNVIKKRFFQNRNKLILASFFIFLVTAFIIFRPENEFLMAKGEFNIGHEDLKCIHCHKNAPGTERQQIQRNLQSFLKGEESQVYFGTNPVESQICITCHNRPNDRHPVHRFMEPKYKKAREEIHPENCISCHAEHNHQRVTLKETGYCINCHKDIEIKNDPIDLKHSRLIELRMWNTCIQCHDFHGNHEMDVAKSINDTIPLSKIKEYFNEGKDPYSKIKKYVANLDSINKTL